MPSAGQMWQYNAKGGYFGNPKLTSDLRHAAQPWRRFRQFTRLQKDFSKHEGDRIYFDNVGDLQAGGQLVPEGSPFPEDGYEVGQKSVIVSKYGNSVPFTEELETFSQYDVNNVNSIKFRNDMANVVDSLAYAAFWATKLVYTPTGSLLHPTYTLSTTGTAGATATRPLTTYDFKNISDLLRTYKIPTYDGENYVGILSVKAARNLTDDGHYEKAQLYGSVKNLFTGEIGRLDGCRFVRENRLLSNSLAGGSGQAVFFGFDPVVEAVATFEEMRSDPPSALGTVKKVGWLYIGGFKKTWDYTADGEEHIIVVDSL